MCGFLTFARRILSNRSLREISDEGREQKAPEGEKTVVGAVKDKILSGAPSPNYVDNVRVFAMLTARARAVGVFCRR